MGKGKKYLLPIALGIVGIYYIIRSLKKTDSVMDSQGNVDTSSGGGTSVPDSTFPLKKGSKGALVKKLQLAIGVDKLPKFGADGDFGTETLNALKTLTGKTQVDSQFEIDKIALATAKKADEAYKLKFGTEKLKSESTGIKKPIRL
jgi:hypothetical protein